MSIIKHAPDWLAAEYMNLIAQQLYFSVPIGPMAGVLDESYSRISPLSGVAYKPPSLHRLETCPSYVAWRAGMAIPLI
jgi:hypothetical protein